MHACRLNAGREGQVSPYIITVLWLSLVPEVLMQIKWEALQTEPLQLPPCLALPSQSLILIVGYRGNFVCSLNALQVSQWPLHILSQIPIVINCLRIIKLLRDNSVGLMSQQKPGLLAVCWVMIKFASISQSDYIDWSIRPVQ